MKTFWKAEISDKVGLDEVNGELCVLTNVIRNNNGDDDGDSDNDDNDDPRLSFLVSH